MLSVFGWGYDAGLSGVAIAFPEFREVYGNYCADGKQWVIPAVWQSLWNAASTIGQVFGGYAAAAVGLSTATPPLYVTENAPANLQSTLSPLTNVIIVLGFFCSSLTGYGASKINGVWSFKLAFVMTFMVPALYLIGLPFFPESPVIE
ncbi:uncharacterized protein MYCFIDRAFT_78046 [Pseudocercospora fijiensis CIRAD86]|uniref:Major facilitator superfamily (MFS) profile domain-containing protein n=1 Tax=Pseudocercospora fijiensis (strain CIRAD86) TaxID=383855 RepID=M3A6R4_PSEFD|nr:uncharacterized protein MYCFIDRAFT_78046 [Pseudocercospora fijiensis CIRAD86]EME80291.1 hypothetical protein MYCFIDRAFT_78046 [Pseudocercospora fijiensis CIRAD86]